MLRGIALEMLTRQIEGSGTVTSPLVPWNSHGAYMAVTLGIATTAYLSLCLFYLLDFAVAFLSAILGLKSRRITPEKEIREMRESADFRGDGGHVVGPAEHETAFRKGG